MPLELFHKTRFQPAARKSHAEGGEDKSLLFFYLPASTLYSDKHITRGWDDNVKTVLEKSMISRVIHEKRHHYKNQQQQLLRKSRRHLLVRRMAIKINSWRSQRAYLHTHRRRGVSILCNEPLRAHTHVQVAVAAAALFAPRHFRERCCEFSRPSRKPA